MLAADFCLHCCAGQVVEEEEEEEEMGRTAAFRDSPFIMVFVYAGMPLRAELKLKR